MPRHHLLRLRPSPRLLNPPNIQRPILSIEAAHTAHIVSVIRELISSKAVFRAIRHILVRIGECVSVFAFPAVGTAPPGEEETGVFHPCRVGAGEACVGFDVAARLGFCFARERGGGVRNLGGLVTEV